MRSETRTYRTGDREVVLNLTQDADAFVEHLGDGLLHVFVPHATAGIAITRADEYRPIISGTSSGLRLGSPP